MANDEVGERIWALRATKKAMALVKTNAAENAGRGESASSADFRYVHCSYAVLICIKTWQFSASTPSRAFTTRTSSPIANYRYLRLRPPCVRGDRADHSGNTPLESPNKRDTKHQPKKQQLLLPPNPNTIKNDDQRKAAIAFLRKQGVDAVADERLPSCVRINIKAGKSTGSCSQNWLQGVDKLKDAARDSEFAGGYFCGCEIQDRGSQLSVLAVESWLSPCKNEAKKPLCPTFNTWACDSTAAPGSKTLDCSICGWSAPWTPASRSAHMEPTHM